MPYLSFFSALSSHIETLIVAGGYPLLFLTVVLEGIPLIGTIVPGHVAIIAAGFFARIGTFDLALVFTISMVAAILGDCIGYILGRKYGMSLIGRLRRYFFISDMHIEKAKNLLGRHTGVAMIIGRFTPMTRALMPFLVGTGEASVGTFFVYNLIGALAWVGASIGAGYVFGLGYSFAAGFLGRFIPVSVILIIVIIWGYRFANQRFHIFKKYELFVVGLNVISLLLLAKTIQDAFSIQSFLANFDVAVNVFMATHVSPLIVHIASIVSDIGGVVSSIALGVLAAITYLVRGRWRSAALLIAGLSTTGLAIGVMKELFMRARPDNAVYVLANNPSFPSAHAALAAALAVALAYLWAPQMKSWVTRELLIVLAAFIPLVVGFSRVVLNVHWASDVLAGWALGIFCATGSILLTRYISILVMKKSHQA